MSVDLEREPNYDVVVDAILQKTLEGKLQWHETADENKFIAAVKGERVFELTMSESGTYVEPLTGQFARPIPTLVVRDGDGKQLFLVRSDAIDDLYRLVWRIVNRVDEKVDATYELLSHL